MTQQTQKPLPGLETLLEQMNEESDSAASLTPEEILALLDGERIRDGIGTLAEKSLHALLKGHYAGPGALCEVPFEGYVADILGKDGGIEIQTRNFDRLRKKLEAFLPRCPVTVVYPIPHVKWLRWIDPDTGETGPRRKSPKTGSPYHAFPELYKLGTLIRRPGLRIRLTLLDVEEIRLLNGWSRDRKKGSTRWERIPLAFVEEVRLDSPADYRKLIPASLPPQFTSKDYAAAAKLPLKHSQTALLVLGRVGVVEKVGKQGRSFLYERR